MQAATVAAIGLGLQGFAMIAQGAGDAAGLRHQAQQMETARRVGEIQADQIDAAHRRELADTFGNMRAIAASAGVPIDSQAFQAAMLGEEVASNRARRTAVANARMQANQFGLDAIAYRRAARFAFAGGVASGLSQFAQIPSLYATPAP